MASKNKNDIVLVSFNDTEVIGINSGLMDYKLAWCLNNALSLDFTRRDDFVYEGGAYPLYHCHLFENSPIYDLVAVKCGDKVLLNHKPRIDYLFLVRNEQYKERIDIIIQKINTIEGVSFAFPLDGHKGKIETILYDIEQYEVDMLTLERERNTAEFAREQIRKRDEYLGVSEE